MQSIILRSALIFFFICSLLDAWGTHTRTCTVTRTLTRTQRGRESESERAEAEAAWRANAFEGEESVTLLPPTVGRGRVSSIEETRVTGWLWLGFLKNMHKSFQIVSACVLTDFLIFHFPISNCIQIVHLKLFTFSLQICVCFLILFHLLFVGFRICCCCTSCCFIFVVVAAVWSSLMPAQQMARVILQCVRARVWVELLLLLLWLIFLLLFFFRCFYVCCWS